MKHFFVRKHKFINPLRHYWLHRRQMVADFPSTLPPDEDEVRFYTTKHRATYALSYATRPMQLIEEESEKTA